ncbi:MAG: hypothetical protein J0I11_18375 [Actinobacteria bacterium]|nr:hypothetical protein [Actinomycetota bacterium]
MRTRSALLSLVCAAALVTTGCASQVTGTPQGVTGGGVANTAQSSATGGSAGTPQDTTTDGASQQSGESSSTDGASSPDLTLPTDLSNLTNIPGLDPGCLAAAGIAMGFGMLMLAPIMGGQQVTADDVNKAFADLGEVPPELKGVVDVLHKAAVAATGQSLAKAAEIMGTPEVTKAMDDLSKYTDAHCGGGN